MRRNKHMYSFAPLAGLFAGIAFSFAASASLSAAARYVSTGEIRVENAGELLLITSEDFITLARALADANIMDRSERMGGLIGDRTITGGLVDTINYLADKLEEAHRSEEDGRQLLYDTIADCSGDTAPSSTEYADLTAAVDSLTAERYAQGKEAAFFGNAKPQEVVYGYTYLNSDGEQTGSMPVIDHLAKAEPLKAGESMVVLPGYYPKDLRISTASLASQTRAVLSPEDILKGYAAWANGQLVEGNVETVSDPNYQIKSIETERVLNKAAFCASGITVDATAIYELGKKAGAAEGERDGYERGYRDGSLPRTILASGSAQSYASWRQPGMEQRTADWDPTITFWDVNPTGGKGNTASVTSEVISLVPGAYITAPVTTSYGSAGNTTHTGVSLGYKLSLYDKSSSLLASSSSDTLRIPDNATEGYIVVVFTVSGTSKASDPPGGSAWAKAVLGETTMHY